MEDGLRDRLDMHLIMMHELGEAYNAEDADVAISYARMAWADKVFTEEDDYDDFGL